MGNQLVTASVGWEGGASIIFRKLFFLRLFSPLFVNLCGVCQNKRRGPFIKGKTFARNRSDSGVNVWRPTGSFVNTLLAGGTARQIEIMLGVLEVENEFVNPANILAKRHSNLFFRMPPRPRL